MTSTEEATASIPYATPAAAPPVSRTKIGFGIAWIGMFLIILGGCFLIGVMMIVAPDGLNGMAGPRSAAQTGLMVVLYVLAFACFGGAAVLVVIGLKYLFAALRG